MESKLIKYMGIFCLVIFSTALVFFSLLLFYNPGNEFITMIWLTNLVGLLAWWVLYKFERSA